MTFNPKEIKMFSPIVKTKIATAVQAILQTIDDDELPEGEIQFILHVDGAEGWSWANIRNNDAKNVPVPPNIDRNLTA